MQCDCKQPGFCPRYQRKMNARLLQICRGTAQRLTENQMVRIRQRWLAEANGDPRPDPPDPPSLLTRAWTFTAAAARHAKSGLKKRKKSEIAEIVEICQNCPDDLFNGTHCTDCGCRCSGKQLFLNKLAWQSEHCPREHW